MTFSQLRPIRSLDDIRALEQTPLDQAFQVRSTYEIFVNSAKKFGNKTALRFLKDASPGGEAVVWSYADLLERIHQTANLLHVSGVRYKDSVSILMPSCNEYHLALWGGEAAGIVNPLNPLLTVEKLADLMRAANSKALIAFGDDVKGGYWDKAVQVSKLVPSLEKIIRVASPNAGDYDRSELAVEALDFDTELQKQDNSHLISERLFSAEDVAAYFHTGGTTGSPKLAMHTHGNQVFTAWVSVQLQGLSSDDTIINGYPLFHVAGVLPGSLSALSAGVETIIPTYQLMRNQDVLRNYWKLVEHHKVNIISGVPTVLSAISSVPLDGANISSVRFCRTGAAPLPAELAQRYEKLYGLSIYESLGMTEMAGITSITPPGVDSPVGSVGYPVPYSQIKIAALTGEGSISDREVEQGDSGMLLVKSPNVFPGYLNEEETKKAFTEDGWLISGDIGFVDEKGRLNLSGRAKDLIIRSGHNIDPRAIEEVLDQHSAVDLCAAVGEPCPYAGELPVAFVTLKADQDITEQELLDYVSERVEEAPARPKQVFVLQQMPLTNVGKIFKPELRRMAAERAVQRMLDGIGVAQGELRDKGRLSVSVKFDEKADNGKKREISSELSKYPVAIVVHDE